MTLHLPTWLEAQERQSTPFTPAVNSVLALRAALRELAQHGGWQGRHARYGNLADQVARALERAGIQPLLGPGESSCVLRSYCLPEGMDYDHVHDGLKRWGFVIYAGQGKLAREIFRISTMGDITNYDMERLLAAIETVFRR